MHCRGRAHKEDLHRFVFLDGKVLWDERQNIQARGLYLHDRIECLSKAGEVGRWVRALRLQGAEAAQVGRLEVARVLEMASVRTLSRI